MEHKEIRKQAKRSLAWVAVMAGVSEPTAKLFELDESAVANMDKRAALQSVYEQLRRELVRDGERPEGPSTPPPT
jgi:predicted transcriptional regulator